MFVILTMATHYSRISIQFQIWNYPIK